jgi:hypothetical protein
MDIEDKEIAAIVRKELNAYDSRDVKSIVALYENIVGGYGWRTFGWRDYAFDSERPDFQKGVTDFFESHEVIDGELTELHTWSEDDVGLAWGIWTEAFQHKGSPPAKANVRFTFTFKKNSDGWHQIMFHRDIQPFQENGIFPFELVQIK